jgi:3-hydroxybutyryl-CoA dehydrogenase
MSRTERVAVVGVGLLGRGIAGVAAKAGFDVVVHDHDPKVSRRAVDDLRSHGLDVRMVWSLDEAAKGADYVIEAVIEDLAIKQRLFAQAGAAAPSATLMSNSSCLPIGEIAAGTANPERAVGTHWWNPPELIPLVEVIPGPRTDRATVARATAFTERLGKIPVLVARDVAGFVGNRLQHALCRETLALVSDGTEDAHSVDRIVSDTVGRRLAVCGPLAEIDQLGAGAALSELEEMLPLINRDPAPARVLREKVSRGELGAKAGIGFLRWHRGDRERAARELAAYVTRRVTEPPSSGGTLGQFGAGLSGDTLLSARRLRASLWREAIALVADGICDAHTVDLMACRTFGIRLPHMGPVENADFVGLDLTLAVHERIFPTFDPSPTPSSLLRAKAAASGPATSFLANLPRY